jgi:hypothetical protein
VPAETVPVPDVLVQTCTKQGETMDPTSRPSTSSDDRMGEGEFDSLLRLYRKHLGGGLGEDSLFPPALFYELNDGDVAVPALFLRELIARHDAARAVAEGLARRVAEQSELLTRRAEGLPGPAATEAAFADLTNELMPYLASRGLAPAVDSWAELNGRLRVWAANKRVRVGMEVSTPERNL